MQMSPMMEEMERFAESDSSCKTPASPTDTRLYASSVQRKAAKTQRRKVGGSAMLLRPATRAFLLVGCVALSNQGPLRFHSSDNPRRLSIPCKSDCARSKKRWASFSKPCRRTSMT